MSAVRCACYLRASTPSKSRQGDTLSFDQNPDVQEQRNNLCESWSLSAAGNCTAYIRAVPAQPKKVGRGSIHSWPMRGAVSLTWLWFGFDRFARSVKQLVLALEDSDLWE